MLIYDLHLSILNPLSILTSWQASPALSPQAAYIPYIHIERQAYPFQHIHAHSLSCQQLPIGGLADPGQADDVLFLVASFFEESPEWEIADHHNAPPCVYQFYCTTGGANVEGRLCDISGRLNDPALHLLVQVI